jgi:uncharacterized protein (UPF0332 family)
VSGYEEEIEANLERAEASIRAAKDLIEGGYYDFVASRAYYAAFYAATTLLLCEELEFGKHSGVIAFIHREFIRTGKLDQRHGKDLNWLFELRGIRRLWRHNPRVTTRRRESHQSGGTVLESCQEVDSRGRGVT